MRKPKSADGIELDANFTVEDAPNGYDLILESQGGPTGGRPPRNTDYVAAIETHLTRLKALGATVTDLQIASQPIMKLPEEQRRINPAGFPTPIDLTRISDLRELRLAIGRASAAFGNIRDAGGNPTKRLRLRVMLPNGLVTNRAALEKALVGDEAKQLPTADPIELQKRVLAARTRLRRKGKGIESSPPMGQENVAQAVGSASRFVRDPEVVSWVLECAQGRCECCGRLAPFTDENGDPFLEVHHVRPLGQGGPDQVDNAAACCPNCHRQLHYGKDREDLRKRLIASVGRLSDYPAKPLNLSLFA
jgi:5-methylcytosine-specific restriction protein A